MLYNRTSCGLNEAMWVPSFWLPTAKTAGRFLNYNYCFMDKDIGEMFLNFPLSNHIAPFSGFDLTHYRNELGFLDMTERKRKFVDDERKRFLVRWERCWMGFRPSPYWCVRFFYLADEFGRGNPKDKKNALRWDSVKLNLPGSRHFNPSLPWVMK